MGAVGHVIRARARPSVAHDMLRADSGYSKLIVGLSKPRRWLLDQVMRPRRRAMGKMSWCPRFIQLDRLHLPSLYSFRLRAYYFEAAVCREHEYEAESLAMMCEGTATDDHQIPFGRA